MNNQNTPAISIRGLKKSYGALDVLKGIDLDEEHLILLNDHKIPYDLHYENAGDDNEHGVYRVRHTESGQQIITEIPHRDGEPKVNLSDLKAALANGMPSLIELINEKSEEFHVTGWDAGKARDLNMEQSS